MNTNVILTVKNALQNDATSIHSVLSISFADYYIMLSITPPAISETIEDIKLDIADKNVLVIRASNTLIVGTIRFHMIDDVCYISRFGVLPNWQSVGAGDMLMKEVEKSARELGASTIMLHSSSKLLKQVRYYYSQGFFIHSTNDAMGYIRALFVKELQEKYNIPTDFM
ncbi:MAG: GNAT family N-acetyltransferase [Clostridiales bacterium]|nr:GNAT family N-acetyltransferase [Clostridiales bacterium]